MHVSELPNGVPTRMLIGGLWFDAKDGSCTEVFDPATTDVLATVPLAGESEAMDAVGVAYEAQPSWERRAPRERAEILRRSYELMVERAEDIARVIVLENGKALVDARGEVAYAAEFFRWYAEEAVRQSGTIQRAPSGVNQILVLRQAIGVAVLVTPWNFPAAMATRKIAPALAAGCSVILKPATDTPLTALLIAKILADAGVPDGVVNVLPARGSSNIVSMMLHDPRVRKLSFTGSTEVGRKLLHEAADTIISSSMELGGNAPFVVFADADLDAAVAGAMVAKMRNGGEACTAANRFYVEAPVAKVFSEKLAAAMGALKVGPGLEEGTDVGPLINAEAQHKVESLVQDALDRGATRLEQGEPYQGRGYFVRPLVLDSVDPDSQLLAEEIFGPVAPVTSFEGEEEAIALANATEFGLVSYLYTRDLARGLRVSEALEAGMIGLNRGLVSDPAAPFGGVKQSGLGREGGHEGVLEYTEAKYIATSWSSPT